MEIRRSPFHRCAISTLVLLTLATAAPVLAGDSITVVAPNGGEDFAPGTVTDVLWTSSGNVSTVEILLSESGGASFDIIAVDEPNDGSFAFLVPNRPTDIARIRVRSSSDASVLDDSDADFSISGVEVVFPNGGETFAVDEMVTITWNAYGSLITIVDIDLSRDGGATFESIIFGEINDGTFEWIVTGPESDDCLVRVWDSANPLASDESDIEFTITRPVPVEATSWGRIKAALR